MGKDIDCSKMIGYEFEQFNAIEKWKLEEPSVLTKAFGTVAKPVTWLVQKIIPQGAIESVLKGLNALASKFSDREDIIRDGGIERIRDLRDRRRKSLEECDRLADNVHNWAVGAASVEGGVTGAVGIVGIAIDTPALLTMGLRVIYKIGLCYGYEFNDEADKQFVLGILSVASANTMTEKNTSLVLLKQMSVLVAKTAWKNMAEKGVIGSAVITIRNLAKQIGINITKRKAMQAIPVVGAGVGAAMNAKYINDIAWAARRTFQERWLRDNDLLNDVDCGED